VSHDGGAAAPEGQPGYVKNLCFQVASCHNTDTNERSAKIMLTDAEITRSIEKGEFSLEPFEPTCLQPASYDCRVGSTAFVSSGREKIDLAHRGVLVVEPGEFVVVETLEKVALGPRIAAQLGLRSEYARRGLLMLSGPQIDPGFEGILVVRLMNLAPTTVALPYKSPFLTLQVFRLSEPVANPYKGPRQGQLGITDRDIQELTQTEALTLGGVVKTLGALAADVKELRGSIGRLSWSVPLLVAFGIAVIAVIVTIKG
jgi:dCTP deaminase